MQKTKQTYYLSFLQVALILLLLTGMQFEVEASHQINNASEIHIQETQSFQSPSRFSFRSLAKTYNSQALIFSSRSSENRSLFSFLTVCENEQNTEDKKENWIKVSRAIEFAIPTLINKSHLSKSGFRNFSIKDLPLILLSTVVFLH